MRIIFQAETSGPLAVDVSVSIITLGEPDLIEMVSPTRRTSGVDQLKIHREWPCHFNTELDIQCSFSFILKTFTLEVMAVFGWDADLRVCKHVNLSELLIDDVDNVVPPDILWLPDLQFEEAELSKMPSTVNPPVGIELRVSEEDNECHFLVKRRYSCPFSYSSIETERHVPKLALIIPLQVFAAFAMPV